MEAGEKFDSVENLLLALVAEAVELSDCSLLTYGTQFGQRIDPEFVVHRLDSLRSKSRNPKHFDDTGGSLIVQFADVTPGSIGERFGQQSGNTLADSLHIGESVFTDQPPQVLLK